MKTRKPCGNTFPIHVVIEGVKRNLGKRVYCLDCSPFKEHNTVQLDNPIERKNRKKVVELSCAFCGKNFQKPLKYVTHAAKKGQTKFYCSRSCVHKEIRIEHSCATCGAAVFKSPTQSRRSDTGRVYCSRSCANKSNNRDFKSGENHPRYKDGRGISYRHALKEKCEGCGESRYYLLLVHHKDKDRSNNAEENLETLCYNCHATRHLVDRDGVLVVRWDELTSPEVKLLL